MKILGIRFCSVAAEAEMLAAFFRDGLGMEELERSAHESEHPSGGNGNGHGGGETPFTGAVFPAGNSWIEIWPEGPEMPRGIMLQIVVDDADEMAEQARRTGLEPRGPMDTHGERIYYLTAPGGLPVTFQSRLQAS